MLKFGCTVPKCAKKRAQKFKDTEHVFASTSTPKKYTENICHKKVLSAVSGVPPNVHKRFQLTFCCFAHVVIYLFFIKI